MTKVKRPDIQGIRGLAIASVLAFHLKEDQFPAGFVGVDIFFVLSGYLMSSILARESKITLQVLHGFYTRRFKRIVPLYAILLNILFVLVPIFLLARDVSKFISDSVWAAGFATNINSVVQKTDYFAELYDSNVLTHTWSLGVEIQYYLIVPFLYSLQRLLGERFTLPYLLVLITASLSFQCLSTKNVSFNALPSRIWQFLWGAMAHELISWQSGQLSTIQADGTAYTPLPSSDVIFVVEAGDGKKLGEEESTSEPLTSQFLTIILRALPILFSIILYVLSLSPMTLLPNQVLRVTAIALTTAIIVLGCVEERQSLLLSNRPIVYLGDISYVVYLVHWPMVIMWKSYWDLPQLPITDIIICIAITFLISVVIHHTLEQIFITASTTVAFVVVALSYVLMLTAIVLDLPQHLNKHLSEATIPFNVTAAIEWNELQSHNPQYGHRPFEECVNDAEGIKMRDGYSKQDSYECIWKPNNPAGTVRILVVGNSISHRASRMLHSILEDNKKVKEMRLFAHSACRPFENCPPFFSAMMRLVKRMQPDITILISDDSRRLKEPIEDISTDKPLAAFVNFLKPLSANSKYVVLDEFYPTAGTSAGVAKSMYKRLLRNRALDGLKKRYKAFTDSYSSYFRRLDQLPLFIPNLIRHNTSGPLCSEDPGLCWWYNRRNLHAYYTDNLHLTPDGLELERASYTKILEDLIQRVTKND